MISYSAFGKITFIIFITSFLFSCNQLLEPDNTEPGRETPEGEILSKYSSITISVSGTPVSLESILSAPYTHAESRYGQWWNNDFHVNQDGTIDVMWKDESGYMNLSRLSPEQQSVISEISVPASVNRMGRCIGFEKPDDNTFILGSSKANSHGDVDAEAWYTAFDLSGSEIFSTRLFGDVSLDEMYSKGKPGEAGSATVRYNRYGNSLCLYLSHTQKWPQDGHRHQAGWIGFLDPSTGQLLYDGDNQIGSKWFVSHNLDQKILPVSNGDFYLLYHGDGYPRALGISRCSQQKGVISRFDFYDIQYGSHGQPETKASLGDFIELPNGNVAIVYTTGYQRAQRDLRLVIISGIATSTNDNPPVIIKERWITNNTEEFTGWGSRIALLGDKLLVAWNSHPNKYTTNGTHFALLDMNGEILVEEEVLEEATLYPTQSIKQSVDGKSLIWISPGEGNALKINKLSLEEN